MPTHGGELPTRIAAVISTPPATGTSQIPRCASRTAVQNCVINATPSTVGVPGA
jgi:hypothetical protein